MFVVSPGILSLSKRIVYLHEFDFVHTFVDLYIEMRMANDKCCVLKGMMYRCAPNIHSQLDGNDQKITIRFNRCEIGRRYFSFRFGVVTGGRFFSFAFFPQCSL